MPATIEDRPIETVRTEVIDQLIMNYSHGEISYSAFERRLDQAMAANKNVELQALTTDLPLTVDNSYQQSKQKKLNENLNTNAEVEEHDMFISVFSGNERAGNWQVAKKITMVSIFSGASLDFSDAQFTQPVTRIKIFSLFSGDDIFMPENVNVISKAFCIFGAIDNKINSPKSAEGPTIIIEGFSIFSGIDISIKITLKEKFIEFADNLKRMFN
jgi:hypothetical protein